MNNNLMLIEIKGRSCIDDNYINLICKFKASFSQDPIEGNYSATVGMQNASGTIGSQIDAYNGDYFSSNMSIEFRRPYIPSDWLILSSTYGELYNGESDIINLEINAEELIEGLYDASIIISSNNQSDIEMVDAEWNSIFIDTTFKNIINGKVDKGSHVTIEGKQPKIDPDGQFSIRIDLFKRGGGQSESERLKVPLLGEIPLAQEIMEATDAGEPIVSKAPEAYVSKIYKSRNSYLAKNRNRILDK